MINSRSLADLLPSVRKKAQDFITRCAGEGIDVLITSTWRDQEAQDVLYAQGRTKPGNIVTMAKGGQSFHNWRCAFDFVPIVNGKPRWDDGELFRRCGEVGEACGLEWAGRWVKFKELAHLQDSKGLTLAQWQAGEGRTLV